MNAQTLAGGPVPTGNLSKSKVRATRHVASTRRQKSIPLPWPLDMPHNIQTITLMARMSLDADGNLWLNQGKQSFPVGRVIEQSFPVLQADCGSGECAYGLFKLTIEKVER